MCTPKVLENHGFFSVLWLMAGLFQFPIIQTQHVTLTIASIGIFLGVFLCAAGAYYALKVLVAVQTKRGVLRREQGVTLLQLGAYVLFVAAFLIALQTSGISLTYLFVGSAALLVGLGFGLQQLFLDLVSGVILLLDRNINLGDVIKTGDFSGRINRIGIRTTQLVTIDNILIVIPNSKFMTTVLNDLASNRGVARFRIQASIGYDCPVEKVRLILMESALACDKVERTPEPTVIIKDFGENGYTFELRFWLKELFQTENILSDVRYIITERFARENIHFAYPQRVLHTQRGRLV